MSFDPIFSLPQVVLLILLAIGLAAWLYRRAIVGNVANPAAGRALAALRIVAVAIIAALLLNPVVTRTRRDPAKPPLLILIDSSHSMAVKDVDGQQRRFDVARKATLEDTALLQRLQAQYTCRLFRVADTATPQDFDAFLKTAQPDGSHTYLGESILTALGSVSNTSSGGILLVSDGRNNGNADPLTAAHQAKARRFPLFTICLGDTKQPPDVALVNRRPQIYAVPQQRVSLTAEVHSTGYNGQIAQADLLRADKVVQTKAVPLDDHKAVPLSFEIQENREGSYHYALSIRPMPKELTTSNNRSSVFVQVLKSKARVLVLEGRPSWDAKFLLKALRTDPSIQVDAIFKITNEKYFALMGAVQADAQSPAQVKIPKTPAELAKYDVIIIGKGYEGFFDAKDTEALKSFVADHAGNLIFLRGKPDERTEALRGLEPIQWSADQISDIRMQLTDEGQRNPAFNFTAAQSATDVVQKLPTMISATRVVGEKALSVVLARAAGVASGISGAGNQAEDKEMAVLAYQNYGQGKVLSLVGEGLWRWALLPPELKDYTTCYSDFWTQLVRWMVNQSDFLPGQDVSLKTDRATYAAGDSVGLLAFVRGKTQTQLPPVTITQPDGRSTQLMLGKAGGSQADFVGAYKPQGPGEYVAALARPGAGSIIVPFSVYPDSEEDLVTAADPELMRQIAHEGGGEALTVSDLKELPDKLRQARMTLTDKTAARSAWDQSWVLALILALLTCEWALRRRFGLL
jgi:hypothetical protein